jgi:hypothetical protein
LNLSIRCEAHLEFEKCRVTISGLVVGDHCCGKWLSTDKPGINRSGRSIDRRPMDWPIDRKLPAHAVAGRTFRASRRTEMSALRAKEGPVESFIIRGGARLKGKVEISGSKNSSCRSWRVPDGPGKTTAACATLRYRFDGQLLRSVPCLSA